MRQWRESIAVYLDRRVLSILFFGFSSGLPLLLVYSTLSAWLKQAGVSKTAIGLVSLVGGAYALKYVWSPLVDRLPLPILTRLLGRRRSWMLVSQIAVGVSIVGLGATDPTTAEGLRWTVICAAVVAFFSATQDIVIDAYRVEILEEYQLGAGAANVVLGYRIGLLASGAGALILADLAGWFVAYATMGALMIVGVVATLINPEPAESQPARGSIPDEPQTALARRMTGSLARLRPAVEWIHDAVVCPFRDFMTRRGWLAILIFVGLYKYGDALLGVMANPFYLELGFSTSEIGAISKGFGLAMTIVGGLVGGVLVARIGILRSLLVCGILQGLSNLAFVWQAQVGHSVGWLAVTISVESLTGGMGTAAFVAYLSSLCNIAYTATQYALLSSFMAFARTVLASGGGWLADHVSWTAFFVITTFAAIPGLVLLLWLMRLDLQTGVEPPSESTAPDPQPSTG